jgi:hypothetical protein
LTDIALIESPAKKEGKQVFVLLAPDPVKVKDFQKKEELEAKAAGKASAPAPAEQKS